MLDRFLTISGGRRGRSPYQGQAVYTIVEQPDGSLKLTNYEFQPVDSAGGLGETIIPDYQVVSMEQRPAEPHEVALLYP